MYLQFENNNPIDSDFPNKKLDGARWFRRSQECLLFKDGSSYPDKFELTLSFSNNLQDQQSISCFTAGKYELLDTAFGFDNRRNPIVDFTQIKPISDEKKSFLEKNK
jgi:hypothetical protein